MKQALLVPLLFVSLAGCSSLAPPKHVASYSDDRTYDEVLSLMFKQAMKCWERSPGFFKDGVDINAYFRTEDPDTFVIYARRYGVDIGHVDTFLRVEVKKVEDGKAQVDVSEGEFTTGQIKHYAADVPRWFDGDLACIKH